jgi:hypothetical protein
VAVSHPDDLLNELERMGISRMRAEAAAKRAAPRDPKEHLSRRSGRRPSGMHKRVVVQWLRLHGCLVSATFTEQRGDSSDPKRALDSGPCARRRA